MTFHQVVDIPPINDLYYPAQYNDALIIYFEKNWEENLK